MTGGATRAGRAAGGDRKAWRLGKGLVRKKLFGHSVENVGTPHARMRRSRTFRTSIKRVMADEQRASRRR